MARVPTIGEEDAKRPNRERDCLVGERTRIVNRVKSTLARLGIRNFKPTLRKAAERLATVHTPEGISIASGIVRRRHKRRLDLSQVHCFPTLRFVPLARARVAVKPHHPST
jgi:transposase